MAFSHIVADVYTDERPEIYISACVFRAISYNVLLQKDCFNLTIYSITKAVLCSCFQSIKQLLFSSIRVIAIYSEPV